MKFKIPRLESEFEYLEKENIGLYRLLHCLDGFVQEKFGKEITLTNVFRTKQEQEDLYAYTAMPIKPKISNHMLWNAADIRSTDFTKEEIDEIRDYLNSEFNENNAFDYTAKYHKIIGNEYHFHVQYRIKDSQ